MTQPQFKNLRICRTCFHPIRNGRYVQLQDVCSAPEPETVAEMLTAVAPEIDLKSVVHPVICKNCLAMLQTSYKFRKICVANETRLVEQMQISLMKTVKLNYIGDENNPVIKFEQEEADSETEAKEPLYPLSLVTVNGVEAIKKYCKESGFDTSIEIIEIKTEDVCLEQTEVFGQNDYCLSEDNPVVDPFHEICTEINAELESSQCNLLADQNHVCGEQEIIFAQAEDDPSNNICDEIKSSPCDAKKLKISCQNKKNDESSRERRHKKFFYSKSSYTKHNKSKKFQMKCEQCEITFNRSYIYCKHMMATHNMTFPKCEMCDKYFHNPRLLKRHMCRHLRAKNQESLTDFLCDVCGKHFVKYVSFRSHQVTHRKRGRFKCETCGRMFTGTYGLLSHKKTHTSCKEFMCEMCGMQFKCRSAFRRHRAKHLGTYVKKQRCPTCDKRFENPSRLSLHLLTHNGAKPHTCELCHRGFSLLQNLKRHLRRHTGEKPYVCNVCERRFTRITGLKDHHCGLEKRKSVVLEPKHECNVCGKLFKLKGMLDRHLVRAHTDDKVKLKHLTCEICGRAFTNSSNMRRHFLTHSNIKRFACEVCRKLFRTKYEFMIHTRRHTGEKPYKCQFCEMRFVESGEKSRHEKKHLHGSRTRKKRDK